MPQSITRFGNLGQVFREGESELLNEVARVTILYEDLRLELGELRVINERRDAKGPMDGDDFRVAYFMRRALVTLIGISSRAYDAAQNRRFQTANYLPPGS
jgi:hypothetical protein